MSKKRTVLLGLNEINFRFLEYYIGKGRLSNFKKLFESQHIVETVSESEYKLLEPWIQWVTIHTGKTYNEHKVFRLGDIVDNKELSQLFEELENKGKTIGLVSPFNADNRLKSPSFFIPDPWTKTKVSGNWIIQSVYKAVHQLVNDNAQEKINFKSVFSLLLAFLFYVPISRWAHYVGLAAKIKKPGVRAIVLDSLLSDIFIALLKRKKPDFSNLFLNSGAHIQHHYLFNSDAYQGDLTNPEWYCEKGYDPLIKVLEEYDRTLGRLMKIGEIKIIVATGLHQQPHKKLTYYWRLNNHESFMKKVGINNFTQVLPRMSRDFLLNFANEKDSRNAEALLNSMYASFDDVKIFTIDNRGDSLFIELTYPHNINDEFSIYSDIDNSVVENFKNYVTFVAIKNGEHNGVGYLTSNFKMTDKQKIQLKELEGLIKTEVMK